MPWTDWLPALIASAAGAGSDIIGSRALGKATTAQVAASEKAAELERQTAAEALALEKEMYNRGIQLGYPWLQIGSKALTPLGRGMGFEAPEGGYKIPTLQSLMLSPGTPSPGGGEPSSGTVLPDVGGAGAPKTTSTLGTVGSRALTGAGVGSLIAGPPSAAAGALIGGFTDLFGRGRKEADKIVPLQNDLTAEIKRIESGLDAKIASGSATPEDFQTAANTVTGLRNQFYDLVKGFGRAGPGAVQTIGSWVDPLLATWQQGKARPLEGRMHGGPVKDRMMDGDYIVGENGPEVLDMAPGSKGTVYPYSSFMAMMTKRKRMPMMPGRQAGGPVTDLPNEETRLPDFSVPGNVPYTGPGTQPTFGVPVTSPTSPASPTNDPYANMQPPFAPGEGEFLQPWQEKFTGTVPTRPLPSPDVNLRPFSFNAQDVYKDPSYAFRFGEGAKARERLASAAGTLLSGRTLKDLTRYGQDYASTEYGKAYERALGENMLAYGRDVDQFGRQLDVNKIGYGRDIDAYNRLLNEYGIRYDIFKQNQKDRFERLKQMAGIV